MPLVNVLCALALAAGSFYLGKTVADHYNDLAVRRLDYELEKQYLRLRANMDRDDPCKPYVYSHVPQRRRGIPNDLLTQIDRKMRTDGQATVALNNKGEDEQ